MSRIQTMTLRLEFTLGTEGQGIFAWRQIGVDDRIVGDVVPLPVKSLQEVFIHAGRIAVVEHVGCKFDLQIPGVIRKRDALHFRKRFVKNTVFVARLHLFIVENQR